MFQIEHLHTLDKEEFYQGLYEFVLGLTHDERNLIANLANVASLLFNTMKEVNWAGFYLMKNGELVLGPFNGKPACIRIAVGKGVCGTAVLSKETQLVKDVHAFPGHIACDGDTNSELVIPIIVNKKVVGVLDLDSPVLERFNETDQKELEKMVEHLVQCCDWEV